MFEFSNWLQLAAKAIKESSIPFFFGGIAWLLLLEKLVSPLERYESFYELIFFVSLVVCIAAGSLLHRSTTVAWAWLKKRGTKRASFKKQTEALRYLNVDEALILHFCLEQKFQSISMSFSDSAAQSLREKGIICSASAFTPLECSWTIRSEIWSYLLEHREELLEQLDEIAPKRVRDRWLNGGY